MGHIPEGSERDFAATRAAPTGMGADERTRIMLDATPLCCSIWDEARRAIDCNQEAVKLFELKSKQEYLDRFFELSPEYQPCGRTSEEMAREYVAQAFETGYAKFEWMHQKLDGSPIPAEITLVRVRHGDRLLLAGYTRDLRELKKKLAEIQEANERTQMMLDATPLCCHLWDEHFRGIACNQEAVRMFGVSCKEEFLARYPELQPEYQPCGRRSDEMALEYVKKVMQDGERLTFEWMLRTSAGEALPAEITLVRVKWGEGYAGIGYARDLREHKRQQAAIEEANERMKIMLDATPLCCNFWDEHHHNIDCNQEAVNLFGLKSKQEYLDRFFELSPEYQPCGRTSQEMAHESITQAFETGHARFEWMHQKLDGTPVPAEITLVRVKRGDAYIVAGYTRDLRELKASMAEMQEANERTQIMLDATPLCCNFWDEHFHNIDCNQEAVNLFGLKDKQEYLDRFFELSPEYQPCGRTSQEMAHEYIAQAFETGRAQFEWVHQKLDGTPVPAEITLVRVKRGDAYIVAGYTRDLRELKAQMAAKEEAYARIQIMLDATPLGCHLWNDKLEPIDCNQEVLHLFGLSSKQEALDGFFALSPEYQPDGRPSREAAFEYIRKAFELGSQRFEWMHQKPNGEPIPSEVTLMRVKQDSSYIVTSYIRDLRELKAHLAEIREANERTQIMLDATPLCCNFWDEHFHNVDCNQEAVNLFGLKNKQEYLERFLELSPKYQPVGRLSSELAREYVEKAFATGRVRFEWMHQTLGGEPIPAEITLVRVKRHDQFIVAGYTRDLRELKETVTLLNKLEKLAFTDNLTGAFNRHYFMEHAGKAFMKDEGGKEPACIIMFDIDHFKNVNDTYGHSAGDTILQGVAQRVQSVLRNDDLFARYGGEEFIVYASKASMSSARRLAERIRRAVASARFTYGGNEIRVTVSLGVADRERAHGSFSTFIDLADEALYSAKAKGRNRVES